MLPIPYPLSPVPCPLSPVPFPYSCCSATTGSIFVARRAGITQATNATLTSMALTETMGAAVMPPVPEMSPN